ncbi:MAG: hypothetical protein ACC655_04955 [Rhodothermia bacterium]
MLARSTFTRITGIAVLTVAPMLVGAQVDSDPKLGLLSEATVMKSYRSPGVAYLLAVSGIVVPWVFAPSYYESWGEAFRFAALLSAAPSLGHIYAADYSEALLTTAVRFGGVVTSDAEIVTVGTGHLEALGVRQRCFGMEDYSLGLRVRHVPLLGRIHESLGFSRSRQVGTGFARQVSGVVALRPTAAA